MDIFSFFRTIDREIYPVIDLVVVASDGFHNVEWKRTIPVEDVNDNAPVFTKSQYSFDIYESASKGAIVGLTKAHDDDDTPSFKQITYQLVSDWGTDTFSMDPASGIITLASGANLDHEETEHFVLIASASDAGTPALTATATVYINVLDINDNPPHIEQSVYAVSVQENSPAGTFLARIKAEDPDQSESRVGLDGPEVIFLCFKTSFRWLSSLRSG